MNKQISKQYIYYRENARKIDSIQQKENKMHLVLELYIGAFVEQLEHVTGRSSLRGYQ